MRRRGGTDRIDVALELARHLFVGSSSSDDEEEMKDGQTTDGDAQQHDQHQQDQGDDR